MNKSVCQTRTVTSFYAAVLLLAAAYAGRAELSAAVHTAAAKCEAFQQEKPGYAGQSRCAALG